MAPEAIFAGQSLVTSIAFVGQFARTVNHHFVSPVIGNIDEILLALVAAIENAGVAVDGHVMPFQIEGAVEDFVANLADGLTSFLATATASSSHGS